MDQRLLCICTTYMPTLVGAEKKLETVPPRTPKLGSHMGEWRNRTWALGLEGMAADHCHTANGSEAVAVKLSNSEHFGSDTAKASQFDLR